MPALWGATLRRYGVAFRAVVLLTVLAGLVYPVALTGVGQLLFPGNANGSLAYRRGVPVGSELIGQRFPGASYFHSRPSAAGTGDDPLASSASNLGPDSRLLIHEIRLRRSQAARADGVPAAEVAPDALLASGSGLDPQISPEYAGQQVARVARERDLPVKTVQELVRRYTEGRSLGFLGEARVNVLELNLALDAAIGGSGRADSH